MGDLADLLRRMHARIARIGLQRVWREPKEAITRPAADLEGRRPELPVDVRLCSRSLPIGVAFERLACFHLAATLVETYLMHQDGHDVEPERKRQVAESLARQLSGEVGRTERVLEPSRKPVRVHRGWSDRWGGGLAGLGQRALPSAALLAVRSLGAGEGRAATRSPSRGAARSKGPTGSATGTQADVRRNGSGLRSRSGLGARASALAGDGSQRPRNQPGAQTAPAGGPDRGSPYRRTGPGALRRVDDKERSLGAGLDGARVRNSDGSWAHGASCIEWPKAPSGGKEIKMRRTKINRATGIRAPSVTIKSSPQRGGLPERMN